METTGAQPPTAEEFADLKAQAELRHSELLARLSELQTKREPIRFRRFAGCLAIGVSIIVVVELAVGTYLIGEADQKITAQRTELTTDVDELTETADGVQATLDEIDIENLNRLGPTGEELASSLSILGQQLGFLDSNLCSQPAEGTPTMIEGWCPP